jgi:hypothetical protein
MLYHSVEYNAAINLYVEVSPPSHALPSTLPLALAAC